MGIKIGIDLRTSLSQTLTPQQIQYLKLLQLPVIQLEQHIQRELESNPMLEENNEDGLSPDNEVNEFSQSYSENPEIAKQEIPERAKIDDEADPFEFYKMIWQDDSTYKPASYSQSDEDGEPFQIKHQESFTEELVSQFSLLDLSRELKLLGLQIIGNVDDDGYLRRDIQEIIDETNSIIADHNFKLQQEEYEDNIIQKEKITSDNPAANYALKKEAKEILHTMSLLNSGQIDFTKNKIKIKINSTKELDLMKPVNQDDSESILDYIRHLDPPGVGSRSIQECLLSQLENILIPTPEEKLAIDILLNSYNAFTKKHYSVIIKQNDITEDNLRDAIEVIKHLNPKPGGGEYFEGINTVIPDFLVTLDDAKDDLIITVNDGHMPHLKLSKAYESIKKEAQYKQFNKETKNWVRSRQEDAKFIIQAIRQRKNTMMKVQTAIAARQKDFFYIGESGLKPMIYKDISEDTGLDISTVCRIVNGKYVQTDFGTYELKFFFSEALVTDDGEDVSTKVIKQVLKVIIESESKEKPFSDDKLSKLLKEKGYKVARRTVAKYREQLKIPVARLRKEI